MGITSKDVKALSHTASVSDAARHGVRLFADGTVWARRIGGAPSFDLLPHDVATAVNEIMENMFDTCSDVERQ